MACFARPHRASGDKKRGGVIKAYADMCCKILAGIGTSTARQNSTARVNSLFLSSAVWFRCQRKPPRRDLIGWPVIPHFSQKTVEINGLPIAAHRNFILLATWSRVGYSQDGECLHIGKKISPLKFERGAWIPGNGSTTVSRSNCKGQ